MKRRLKFAGLLVVALITFSFAGTSTNKYKCLIQMSNYEGEGAYVVVSLLNPEGKYEKTLYVQGDDSEWYYELEAWWKFYGKKRPKIDGITGGTISGGERSMIVLEVDPAKINKGYKLRFESAVEAKNYFKQDIEFSLTTANLQKKYSGKGFIRYIRLLPQ